MSPITDLLLHGAKQMRVPLKPQQLAQLEAFLLLIQKWNRAYNLVGATDTQTLIQKHLLDCLAIAPYITDGPVLDVGSGAGLPGIPLAIAHPDISFTLLDSNGKKTRFMRQAAIELQLENVDVAQSRVEDYTSQPLYKLVLSRAFAPLPEALKLLAQHCVTEGQIGIMLGEKPEQLPQSTELSYTANHKLVVPGLDSKRHLLIASKI